MPTYFKLHASRQKLWMSIIASCGRFQILDLSKETSKQKKPCYEYKSWIQNPTQTKLNIDLL